MGICLCSHLQVPTHVHVHTQACRVHALNIPLKAMKMPTELFLVRDPKLTDDHLIATTHMESCKGWSQKQDVTGVKGQLLPQIPWLR